jgi:hypothetical protein
VPLELKALIAAFCDAGAASAGLKPQAGRIGGSSGLKAVASCTKADKRFLRRR